MRVGGKERRRHFIEHKIDLLGDGNVRCIEEHGVGGAAQGAFGAGRVDVVALAQVFNNFVEPYVLAGGGQLIELVGQRYRDAGVADVTVQLYPGARHETLNETNRDEVTADLVAWLDGVTARAAA